METVIPKVEVKKKGKRWFYRIDDLPWKSHEETAIFVNILPHSLYTCFRGKTIEEKKIWISEKVWLIRNNQRGRTIIFKRDGIWLTGEMVVAKTGLSIGVAIKKCWGWVGEEITYEELMSSIPVSVLRANDKRIANSHNKGNAAWKKLTRKASHCAFEPGILERKYLNPQHFTTSGEPGPIKLPTEHYHGRTY